MDDNIITGDPVDGGGDLVLVASLEGVDDAENLGGVAARGGGVGEDQTNRLLGVDDEYRADGEGDALGVDVGGVLVVNHVVGEGDLAFLVADDGEGDFGTGDFVNVLDPAVVGVDCVRGEADELDAALCELGLELGESAELGGADGRVVFWVGEEDYPLVADELVEVDGTLCGFGFEVGGCGAQTETVRGGRLVMVLREEIAV